MSTISTYKSNRNSLTISTRAKTAALSTVRKFANTDVDAISDMNLELLRKFIVTSICAIWQPWPTRISILCLTVNKAQIVRVLQQESKDLILSPKPQALRMRQVIRHLISKRSQES